MSTVNANRLHAGLIEFAYEHFEKTCDGMDNPSGLRIIAENGDSVCDNNDYYPCECDPEYTRRIMACLKYCHGMTTDDLEKQATLLGVR